MAVQDPGQQEELPKRLPLVIEPENRDNSPDKDARLVNAYCERKGQSDYHIFKRPGMAEFSIPAAAPGTGRGIYNWLGDIYAVVGGTLYKNSTSLGAVDTTNGVYRFSQSLGATPRLQLGNGVEAYNYDSGAGLVNITDVDFPSSFVKGWAFLDTTTYVMRTADAGIQGSGLNDTVNWDPLNVLIAQIEPDLGTALAKQLVYVVAFKQWSTEVFYDAANATGSPLGRVQGAKVNWGCASEDAVQDLDGILFWPGTTRGGGIEVIMLDNVKATVVSDEPVERLLNDADFSNVYSWTLKLDGHKFYVLTLVNDNLTLAYDMDEKMWSQWKDADGNYVPIVSSTYGTGQIPLLQHESNGKIYEASSSYTNDDGAVITVDIFTPNFDGGVKNNKHLSMLRFVADKTDGSILMVRNNDHDYDPKKWTNFRRVDLGQNYPFLDKCGTFRRRAYHLQHRANTRLRIQALELQIDLGPI